jgi:HK97 gp10 family phage protein
MPFAIKARFEGVQSAIQALDGLDKKIRRKGIRKAALAAGTIILKAAKGRVVKETGLLRKSLGKKVKVYTKGVGVAVVGPRVGFKQEVTRRGVKVWSNPVRYAHLVELGTGRTAAKPFLKPALDATRKQVEDAMKAAINEVIEEARK